MTMLFERQQDRNKDPRSHMLRREENGKWVGPHERTKASQGTYHSLNAPTQLNIATAAEIVDREELYDARILSLKDSYVSAGSALARVMSSSAKSAARKTASSRRIRAQSAVPHAAAKLNDTLSRAWVDRQEVERRARSAAAMRQLLVEAEQVDSTSSAALEKAEKTVEKMTARSVRSGSRSKPDVDHGVVPGAFDAHAEGENGQDPAKAAQKVEFQQGSGRFRATGNKARPLDGKARVWDISGGVHMGGQFCRDVRSPFIEPKRKRHDPEGFYSNTMRPASAAPVMTSHSREQDFLAAQHSGDNSLSALRYPSGVPETFPHRGELHEEVHAVGINPHTKGDRLNFRFKETLRDSKDHDESSTVLRPQSAYPELLRNDPGNGVNQNLENETAAKGCAEKSKKRLGSARQSIQAKSGGALNRIKSVQEAPIACDSTGLSISVGKHVTKESGMGTSKNSFGMMWEGLDGEQISPRRLYHRKRTDLTSRRQVRNGYGIKNADEVLTSTSPPQSAKIRGLKTAQEKRLRHKQYAEEIAAATQLQRPKTPSLFPSHSALPLNRPSEANWAFQTLYMPRTVAHFNPGNVSKIIRSIDYKKERPTFGAHFASN